MNYVQHTHEDKIHFICLGVSIKTAHKDNGSVPITKSEFTSKNVK
jgi:hypothetical protein